MHAQHAQRDGLHDNHRLAMSERNLSHWSDLHTLTALRLQWRP